MDPGKEKFYRSRILQRRDIADDLWSIRVQREADLQFLPGQYATLGVLAPHKHIERPYSIVSSPYEPELEFFFELVPRGELTPALHKLQIGDELTIRRGAKGRFTLDQLPPDALERRAAEQIPRRPSSFSRGRRQPLAGVRVQRRAPAHRRRSSLVQIRSHGQPSMGGPHLGRRSGPRGRSHPQVCRP